MKWGDGMRLIDADWLLERMRSCCVGYCCECDYNTFLSGDVHCGLIDEQPTIEAIPVVHGEWIAQDEGLTKFMCSICKGKNYGGHEKFCPNCGADMRKKV